PFADLGRGDVTDVVDVEDQERAEFGILQRLADARQPIAMQPPIVDPFLKVDSHDAERRQGTAPVEARIDVLGADFTCTGVHGRPPLAVIASEAKQSRSVGDCFVSTTRYSAAALAGDAAETKYSIAACTPPFLCGTLASASAISVPASAPNSISSLMSPRWPMRNILPANGPKLAPYEMLNCSS